MAKQTAQITHRTIQTNGITMHIAEAGEGPLVLLLHGFPESWYSWRHQLPALAAAGYHAVAPDQRGYGRTDAPAAIEDYDILHLTADATGVLDALGEETGVVVGHDWGAPVAWHCALLYPERFPAVAALSVPYMGRGPLPPLQMMRQVFANQFFYIIYFQTPGVAEAELEADVRRSLRLFLYTASGDLEETDGNFWQKPPDAKFLDGLPEPKRLPPWLTEADLDYFAAEFERTGFRGPLNWYRNFDRNWELTPQLAGAKVGQPALFVAGEKDGVMRFTSVEPMKQLVPDMRKLVMLPGCGHWTQQERPAEVNAELIAFLKGL
ncbi:MAG: alpha/beta hydrolase [Chloroflexota bacterium]|nr:alpha/beta hydrolase [Chloroflexota bacterium]